MLRSAGVAADVVGSGLGAALAAAVVELVVWSGSGAVSTGVAVAEALPDVPLAVDGSALAEETAGVVGPAPPGDEVVAPPEGVVGVVGAEPPDKRVDGLAPELEPGSLVVVGMLVMVGLLVVVELPPEPIGVADGAPLDPLG